MYQPNTPDVYGSNPYTRTMASLKEFLRHPITLILAVLFSLSFLFSFIGVFSTGNDLNQLFSLARMPSSSTSPILIFYYVVTVSNLCISALVVAGLWVCYAKSKDPSPNSSPSAGLTLLNAVAIINLVFIILLGIVVLFLLIGLLSTAPRGAGGTAALLFFLFLLIYTILLLGVIGLFSLTRSLKKSIQSALLVDKGSVLFGVMYILFSIFQLIFLFASFQAGGMMVLTSLLSFVSTVMLVVAALRYHSFAGAKNAGLSGAVLAGCGQAGYPGSCDAPGQSCPNPTTYGNPPPSAAAYCPYCGTPNPPQCKACHKCGTPLS